MTITLKKIIEADAFLMRDVDVTIDRRFRHVTIKDEEGEQEDIFLQGQDAEQFIDQFDALIEQAPDVLFVDAIKHLAKPYVECIWS